MNLKELLPVKARKIGYLVIALLGVVHIALLAGVAAAGISTPSWLVVGGTVFGAISTAAPVVALFNLNPDDLPEQPRRAAVADDEAVVKVEADPNQFPVHSENH